MFLSAAFVICLVPSIVAKPFLRRWNDIAVKHSWVEVPRGWQYHSSAPADHEFSMRIALKQDNIDALIANLWETSDPTHERYGQHLTPAEAEALVAPHPDSREAVNAWLEHHGIPAEDIVYSTGGGEWITVRVSVSEAERMLDTKYNVYHHPASNEKIVRALSYSLPRELHSHVDVVTPTTYFSTIRSMRSTSFLQPLEKEEALPEDFDINAAVPASRPNYAIKVCNLFAQLGSIGTTAFFSSGDEGVGAGDCLTNDGTGKKIFQPAFPASCPFVTTVGGTTRVAPEVAVSFSGGGFSRYFAQPSYQSSAVATFLSSLGTTFSGLYNATGRAYPDVSAQANNFRVIIGGSLASVGGTSASSPTVAAIFSLLNDVRLAANKPTLGFVNPLIYSQSSAFNDVISGSNPGCGTNGWYSGIF
ncbi:hypothetical protein C0992_011897 [Termitomyces sp. T32_za158]|nr:hypothetical protein C0992_011897 [Termitomyces sp. T32_za158]